MRITEGKLRRIIKESLDEMAYVETLTGHDGEHVVLPGDRHWKHNMFTIMPS